MNLEKLPVEELRSALNGILVQNRDTKTEVAEDLKIVTSISPTEEEIDDLLFAARAVKHLKSNAIAIVKNRQLIGAGMGQTSRVDAVMQAIEKAGRNNFDTMGAVMASDAFFPFHDSIQIASKAGIHAVIQPGGSIRDQESIAFCNENNISMIFTGIRHFKH